MSRRTFIDALAAVAIGIALGLCWVKFITPCLGGSLC